MGRPVGDEIPQLLAGQLDYYRARAMEYDEWFLRRGRYDRGPETNAQWFAEGEEVRRRLEAFRPAGRVLELACGTGLWTQHLARFAESLTALDASPEALALNQERLRDDRVRYVEEDIFSWRPPGRYDVVFFSFWLSHVPPACFDGFWELVRACLAPGGRVFLVDSLYAPTAAATDHQMEGPDSVTTRRRLNDGREFTIVKVFYRPEELSARLAAFGWQTFLEATSNFFLYGSAQRHGEAAPWANAGA
jgi:SAM-dependent methyltransferase